MRGKWLLFVGTVLILAAGAGMVVYVRRGVPQKPVAKATPELPPGAEVRLTGTIRAVNIVQVPAPLDGVAEEFSVKPGDEVSEGQLLGRIANDVLKENEHEAALQLDRAKEKVTTLESEVIAARLEESRASADSTRAALEAQKLERVYQRQQLLHREGATPRNTFVKAEEEYQSAKRESETLEAQMAALRERVQKASRDLETARKAAAERQEAHDSTKESLASADIISPADGLILAIKRGAGDEVQKGMPDLIEIARDLSQLELVVEPEPKMLARIEQGAPAFIQSAEVPGDGIPGQVKSVAEGKVVIEFASPTPLIRPGATAVVRLKLK